MQKLVASKATNSFPGTFHSFIILKKSHFLGIFLVLFKLEVPRTLQVLALKVLAPEILSKMRQLINLVAGTRLMVRVMCGDGSWLWLYVQ